MEALYEMRAIRIFSVLTTVIGGMGVMGLGLAIVGLYGLVAFAVGRRTREIGIRMAIGADRTAVVHMVLRQGLVLALVGLAVGVAASVGAGQLLQAAFPSGEDQGDIVALLLVVPHLIGAPQPASHATAVPPDLHHRFAVAVTVTGLVFWLLLGYAVSAVRPRFAADLDAGQPRLA